MRDITDKPHTNKLTTVIFFVFYMAMCFPFVGGGLVHTDTQPWALLVAILLFIGIHLKKRYWEGSLYSNLVLVCFVCAVVIGVISYASVRSVSALARSGANYATTFFVVLASFEMLKLQRGLNESWIKLSIWIWFAVGMVQKFVNPTFLNFLLNTARTTNERGVVSLGCEPSFYGYMCLFFLLFAAEFSTHRIFYVLCLLFQIVYLAASSITIMYLLVFVFFYILQTLFDKKPWGYLIFALGLIGFIGGYLAMRNVYSGNRLLMLLRGVYYDRKILYQDVSILQRIQDITYALSGFAERFGLPHGFSEVRLMSGYGAILYELGIFGILWIVLAAAIMSESRYGFIAAGAMSVIMFSGIQLACPMYAFFLGYCLYKKSEKNRDDCKKLTAREGLPQQNVCERT
jgi:hypothetical protein